MGLSYTEVDRIATWVNAVRQREKGALDALSDYLAETGDALAIRAALQFAIRLWNPVLGDLAKIPIAEAQKALELKPHVKGVLTAAVRVCSFLHEVPAFVPSSNRVPLNERYSLQCVARVGAAKLKQGIDGRRYLKLTPGKIAILQGILDLVGLELQP